MDGRITTILRLNRGGVKKMQEKGKVIAIEFDNTITNTDKTNYQLSSPNHTLVKHMREWIKHNEIIITTCRDEELLIPLKRYLKYHDIPFTRISNCVTIDNVDRYINRKKGQGLQYLK